jgi:hypothetical protein
MPPHIPAHSRWRIDLEIIADVIKNDHDPPTDERPRLTAFVERMDL